MLQEHCNYIGFSDKIQLLSEKGKEDIVSADFLDPLAKKAIITIEVGITGKENELVRIKRDLVTMELVLVQEFDFTYAPLILSSGFIVYKC